MLQPGQHFKCAWLLTSIGPTVPPQPPTRLVPCRTLRRLFLLLLNIFQLASRNTLNQLLASTSFIPRPINLYAPLLLAISPSRLRTSLPRLLLPHTQLCPFLLPPPSHPIPNCLKSSHAWPGLSVPNPRHGLSFEHPPSMYSIPSFF